MNDVIKLYNELKDEGWGTIDTLYTMKCLEQRGVKDIEDLTIFTDRVYWMWCTDNANLGLEVLAAWLVIYVEKFGKEQALTVKIRELLDYCYDVLSDGSY